MEKANGKIRISSGELVLLLKLPVGTMLGFVQTNMPQLGSYGAAFEPWYEINFVEPVKEEE